MTEKRHLRPVEDLPGSDESGADPSPGSDPFAGREAPERVLLTARQKRDLRRAKRAALWVGLILPLVLTAVAVLILIAWLPRTPDPVASHWSGSDGPDGFMNPVANLLFVAGMGAGMSLLLGLLAVFASGRDASGTAAVWSGMNRFMAAMSLGTVVMITLMGVSVVHLQLDLPDARQAPGVDLPLGISAGVAVLVVVGGFLVQPRLRIDPPAEGDPVELELAETERAVWVSEIRPSAVFVWVVAAATLLSLGTAVWLFAIGEPLAWMNLGIGVLLVGLFATMSWFRVRIDEDGVEARSLLGRPRFRVPADDIERVEVRGIHPFAEWGGWGARWVPGAGFGIVMRTGEGIVITRRDGRLFALTVDDAATGAALLSAVAGRAERSGAVS